MANFLSLPGEDGDYASTPDSAAVSITGDIDVRCRLAMDDWTPSIEGTVVSKWLGSGNNRSWLFKLHATPTGTLRWFVSGNGIEVLSADSSVLVPANDGDIMWIRVTWKASDGETKFYTGGSGVVPSWSQLGTTETVVTTGSVLDDGTAELAIGALAGGSFARLTPNKMYRVQVLDGIAGTIAFDADFSAEAPGTTSFAESSSNAATVTINQSGDPKAEIVSEGAALLQIQHHNRGGFDPFNGGFAS